MNKLKNLLNNTIGSTARPAPPAGSASHPTTTPLKSAAPKVQDVEKQRPPPVSCRHSIT